MNINNDNFEAYLLDYEEGRLDAEQAATLKAFVETQGGDWAELTEALPRLAVPDIRYEDKAGLKKKRAVIPLYVKMLGAAAAAGLLLAVILWPEKSLPTVASIPELEPVSPIRLMASGENTPLPKRTLSFAQAQTPTRRPPQAGRPQMELLADLRPVKASQTQIEVSTSFPQTQGFEMIAYRMDTDSTLVSYDENNFVGRDEDESDLSLIGRAIYRLTEGRHDSFASLIQSGLRDAKKEVGLAAADLALMAYQRAGEHFEEMKATRQEQGNE